MRFNGPLPRVRMRSLAPTRLLLPTAAGWLVVLLAVAGTSACGNDSASSTSASVPPRTPAATASDGAGAVTIALSSDLDHVHGLVAGPDGTVLAGTHSGVRRIDEAGRVTSVGPADDLMGFSGEAGTQRLVSSGHPGRGSDMPDPLGLIRSSDGGRTWQPVSLAGDVDFHVLAADRDFVIGSGGRRLAISADAGRTWALGAAMEPTSMAVSSGTVWATTADGLVKSRDGGDTFDTVDGAPDLVVVAAGVAGALWGVDTRRVAWVSTDGRTWTRVVELPPFQAFAALDADRAYAVAQDRLVILSV